MITPTHERERRDWTLLVFIIPIGIILMLVAGQVAVHLVPEWSVNAGMQSNLDPNNLPKQQSGPVQPVLPAILTPLGWLDTFLTPGADSGDTVLFPPFVVFEPSATPTVTLLPPTVVTTPPPPTVTVTGTPSVTASPTVTVTQKPPDDKTPKPTHTDTPTPLPTDPPVTSTLEVETQVPSSPTPVELNIGTPSGWPYYNLPDNNFIVIDLGTLPIQVNGTSETNYYDMVYYEMPGCAGVCMDQVIIGISNNSDGSVFYTVFNWGNVSPDANSNVGVIASSTGTEDDNQSIIITAPLVLNGTTGIAIDVDTALSAPPVGWYQYIVIQVPISDGDGADIDSIRIVEIQISPTPPPAPFSPMAAAPPAQPAQEEPSSQVEEVPIPPVDNVPASPVEEIPAPAVDSVTSSPVVDNEPAPAADNAPSSPADNAPAPAADNAPSAPANNAPAPAADSAPSLP